MRRPKYSFGSLLPVLFTAFLFVGCSMMDDGSYVKPITLYEKVNGNWQLSSIRQIDETAKASNMSVTEMPLTEQFNFGSFATALNADVNNNPSTYAVSGEAPELFPNKGYWDLDLEFPSAGGTSSIIYLYSDAAKAQLTERLVITTPPGTDGVMELRLTRMSNGVPFVSYQYKLLKTNDK